MPGVIPPRAVRFGAEIAKIRAAGPRIVSYNPMALQPGMVLTVEPGVATPYGAFHVEENVVVTATGYATFSTCPWALRTLG